MSYAQKNYDETIGTTGETIAESGALIVAFCNLLDKFGHDIEPSQALIELGDAGVDVTGGLFLGDVSILRRSVSVVRRDFGTPFEDASIVRFEYESDLTGGIVITYAAVESAADQTIIDSYDGEIRDWSVYGEPKAYVTFTDDNGSPLTVTPLRAAEKPAQPASSTYTLNTEVPGYARPGDAESRQNKVVLFSPGTYVIVTDAITTMCKIAATADGPGYWINPGDNTVIVETQLPEPETHEDESEAESIPVRIEKKPAETPAPAAEEDTSVKVRVVPKDADKWKSSWHGYLGPLDYVAKWTVTVKDLEGIYADVELGDGIIHPYAGWFIGPDGKKYFRTKPSVDAGNWYGVPEDALRRHQSDDEFAASLDSINLAIDQPSKGVSRAVEKVGTIDGRFRRLFKK